MKKIFGVLIILVILALGVCICNAAEITEESVKAMSDAELQTILDREVTKSAFSIGGLFTVILMIAGILFIPSLIFFQKIYKNYLKNHWCLSDSHIYFYSYE